MIPKDVHTLIPEILEYVTHKRDFVDAGHHRYWDREILLDYQVGLIQSDESLKV